MQLQQLELETLLDKQYSLANKLFLTSPSSPLYPHYRAQYIATSSAIIAQLELPALYTDINNELNNNAGTRI